MKILIATGLYAPEIGGPATHTMLLEKELPSRGFEIVTVPFSRVRHLPKLFRHIYYTWLLLRANRGADLLYALDPVSVGLPVFIASKLSRKPYVLRIVGDYAWEQAVQRYRVKEFLDAFVERPQKNLMVRMLMYVERLVAHHAVHIIVPSKYLQRIVSKWGIKDEQMTIVYNSFALPVSLNKNKEIEDLFTPYERVIISAGRLVPWKGFRALIEMMPDILEEFPHTLLAIAGDGSQRSELEARTKELGLANSVHFFGSLPQGTLISAIQQSDVFVLNTAYEGFSHQLLEVMALNTPVVTTEVGGNPELIENKKEGLLVSYNDRSALRDAVEFMLKNRSEIGMMTQAAETKAKSFTIERMVGEIVRIFEAHVKNTT